MRRGTVVWVVWSVVSGLLAAGAWVAGSRVSSPTQAAADALPPEPSVITAEVVFRRLSDTIVASGEVMSPDSVVVGAMVPDGVASGVVLAVVAVGDVVREGSVAAVVSGRPVVLLGGSFPLYRDLQRGVEGPDVVMLQEALSRLGFFNSEVDGVFGAKTELAVAALYEEIGFEPPQPDGDGVGSRAPRLRVLADEVVVVVDGLPAVAVAVDPQVGDRVEAGSPLVVLARGEPVVLLTVRGSRSESVTPGTPVRVFVDAAALEAEGVVVGVGEQEADFGEGISRDVLVAVDGLAARHVGMGARAVLATAETEDEVLAVPVGAVFTDASGMVRVVAVIDGMEVSVGVTPGRVIGGFVELLEADRRLVPGLSVVVGWQ